MLLLYPCGMRRMPLTSQWLLRSTRGILVTTVFCSLPGQLFPLRLCRPLLSHRLLSQPHGGLREFLQLLYFRAFYAAGNFRRMSGSCLSAAAGSMLSN